MRLYLPSNKQELDSSFQTNLSWQVHTKSLSPTGKQVFTMAFAILLQGSLLHMDEIWCPTTIYDVVNTVKHLS